jgi:hypothetical protein
MIRHLCTKLQWRYGGNKVYVAGDFNDWQINTLPMTKNSDGIWELTLRLPPGRHQYKMIVDGNWCFDISRPIVRDSHGNINNIIEVEDLNTVLMREINDTYSLFYRHDRSPVECKTIKKIEPFSSELYVIHTEGWEGAGGSRESWEKLWVVHFPSDDIELSQYCRFIVAVADRDPLRNQRQMRELQEALSFAAQQFGHSLGECSLPLRVHRLAAGSPILIVDVDGQRYRVLPSTRIESTRYSSFRVSIPQYFIIDMQLESASPTVWLGTGK